MKIMQGREGERSVVVRFRCRDRHTARSELSLIDRKLLPPGYLVDEEYIRSGRSESNPRPGRKVDCTVVLFHNDSRLPTASFDEIERRFKIVDCE